MEQHNTPTPDELAGMTWFNDMTDKDRAFWLHHAKTAVPAEAWSFFKKIHAETTPEARPVGRPKLDASDKLEPVTVRLTRQQRETLRKIGPEALRDWLDAQVSPLDPPQVEAVPRTPHQHR